ncbi:MAG: LytR C-terminal domain-containing protein [Weeksellaceae bacterium]
MRGVFYLDSNNLQYFGGKATAPVVLAFLPTAVHDMEVVDIDEVEKQLTEFVTTNKLEPAETVMILAPTIYFTKELTVEKKPEEQQAEKTLFLENVPVSELASREYTVLKKTTVVATNQELYLTISDLLQKHKFTVTAVVPAFTLAGTNATGFSTALAQQALKQFTSLKQASFTLKDVNEEIVRPEEQLFETHEKSNNRLFIMLGLFGILVGVLIIVIMLQRQSKANKGVEPTPTLAPLGTANTPPSPIVTTEPTVDPALRETLEVQILNGSGISGQADEVAAILRDLGYEQIETGNATGVDSPQTLIVFKPSVAAFFREEIVASLEASFGEISTRENTDINVDISITTATSAEN